MKLFNGRRFTSFVKRRGLSGAEDLLALIAILIVAFIMLSTTADVVGRYLFDAPITGTMERIEILLGTLIFLSLAYSQRIRIHIGTDFILDHLKGRPYYFVRAFNLFVPLVLFGIMVIYSLEDVMHAYQKGLATWGSHRLPEWPFMVSIPLGGFLLCLRLIVQLKDEFASIIKGQR